MPCLYARVHIVFILPGVYAIRAGRDYVLEEDFMKGARKLAETKKLESKLDYSKV